MKKTAMILSAALVAAISQGASAQVPGIPGQVPVLASVDEINALVLIDVSGSMSDVHAQGTTKMQQAIANAKTWVKAQQAEAVTKNVPIEFALWTFNTSYGDSGIYKIYDFPGASSAQVLAQLGEGGTLNAELVPKYATPLALAGCNVASRIVGDLNASGAVSAAGYEWDKSTATTPARKLNISRRVLIATDGLENTPPANTSHECYYTTSSTAPYDQFEATSWQYKLRNKLLTGSAERTQTLNSGLTVDVNLIFQNFITGLADFGAERTNSGNYAAYAYIPEPTLAQANVFYTGLTKSTNGTYKTITVASDGQVSNRIPGDVDYSGCVSYADYNELLQWYGYAVDPNHPHSYWPDLNADGWVDYMDYLILAENWGNGKC